MATEHHLIGRSSLRSAWHDHSLSFVLGLVDRRYDPLNVARVPDLGLLSPCSAGLGEQDQVNGVGHRLVTLVVGVQVIAAVIGRQ